jgi:hypothetical protein
VLGLLGIGAVFAVRGGLAYRRDHLGGTSRTLTVSYQCGPVDLEWHQPSSTWMWTMVPPEPGHPGLGMPSHFDTELPHTEAPGPNYTVTVHRAHGRLHFDSATMATFTSAAGGKIHLRRYRAGARFSVGCEMINP